MIQPPTCFSLHKVLPAEQAEPNSCCRLRSARMAGRSSVTTTTPTTIWSCTSVQQRRPPPPRPPRPPPQRPRRQRPRRRPSPRLSPNRLIRRNRQTQPSLHRISPDNRRQQPHTGNRPWHKGLKAVPRTLPVQSAAAINVLGASLVAASHPALRSGQSCSWLERMPVSPAEVTNLFVLSKGRSRSG